MDLILWRHAEAVDTANPLADLDRPLTSKGRRQAERLKHRRMVLYSIGQVAAQAGKRAAPLHIPENRHEPIIGQGQRLKLPQ